MIHPAALATFFVQPSLACDTAGAQACASHGGMVGAALLAAVAALGWWVLQQAAKDSGWLKRVGLTIGGLLAAGGVLGFLCGAACHAFGKRAWKSCAHHGSSSIQGAQGWDALPPGHPPLKTK
ncbi:MAG: hypothetical protein HY554_17505 [Elusimicrobia bacterium]|nr:hypothetical protein [Elusimicrobiota bacterium]